MKTLEEVREKIDFSTGIMWYPGCSKMYHKYASLLKPGDIAVDFGTGQAGTALILGLTNPDITVYTFDKGLDHHHIEDHEYVTTIFERIVKRTHNVIFCLGKSLEIYPHWDWEIALLNIDTFKQYEETKEEILRWTPFLKQGGYLTIHDYLPNQADFAKFDKAKIFPGLLQAVEELITPDKYKFLEQEGLTSVWQKL